MMRTAVRCLLAAITTSAVGLAFAAPASAATVTSSTTCTNPYTGSQAGPSEFEVGIPETSVVGVAVEVTVSFAFTNSSGYGVTDLNSFSQDVATTGTATNPVTVTAGSQGAVPNGATITVTESGTWTPDEVGTATFTLGSYSFNTVVAGLTIPITCAFDSTPEAVSSVVSPS